MSDLLWDIHILRVTLERVGPTVMNGATRYYPTYEDSLRSARADLDRPGRHYCGAKSKNK
jgi:hypothetical protein